MPRSIESRRSWVVAIVALAVLTISYGAPLVTVVAMKPIAPEFGAARSAPALAVSLTYIGSGLGGILMGWISGRVGVRRVVIGCSTMLAAGRAVASFGGLWSLYLCNLLLVGLLGSAGVFSPIMAYLTRWFDDHRGSAVALVSSGQYVAGALWPLALQLAVGSLGWRRTMLLYAALVGHDRADGRTVLPHPSGGVVAGCRERKGRHRRSSAGGASIRSGTPETCWKLLAR
jgi:MFS family permease